MYHYAGNNPVKYTDPTGEFVIPLAIPVLPAIGTAIAKGVALAGAVIVGLVLGDAASEIIKSESQEESPQTPSPLVDSGASSAGAMPPPDEDEDNSKNNISKPQKKEPASEKTAKDMARQIGKDLGKDARREFHDAKQGEDRSLQELKEDASQIYREYGKEIPKWMRDE